MGEMAGGGTCGNECSVINWKDETLKDLVNPYVIISDFHNWKLELLIDRKRTQNTYYCFEYWH